MYTGFCVKHRCYSCPIVMKREFSRQIFEKYTNIEFQENPSSANRVVPCGRTDRHDEAKSSLSQFCERAYKTLSIASTIQ